MAEKRAAASLDELRAAVERDFSKNVVVSHGLFRSPYPFGAHLFCEVDTSTLDREKWGDSRIELVLRVIALPPGNNAPPAKFTKFLKVLHRDATLAEASFESLVLALEKTRFFSKGLKDLSSSRGNSIVEGSEEDGYYQQRLLQLCLGSSHPCIVPLKGAFLGKGVIYLVFPPAPFTLRSLLHFSPGALGNDWQLRLLLYQIIAGLAHCHRLEVFHVNLTPSSVLLTSSMWCWLTGFATTSKRRAVFDAKTEPSRGDDELEWRGQFKKWFRGELSNFDYLLLLNRLAGRRWGDRCFHTVMPWVVDFTAKPDEENDAGWRDLTKSKWRLAKGDEQLDFTHATAEIPHHVSDECLSELAVCIYKARRLPLLVLRRVVRSVYEPNEYPVNMQRLYHWTPDECIPEFYSDPEVFRSIHQGMGDLAVPSWAEDPEDFIRLHRSALESDRVSRQLHHWVDLTFGYKLSGEAAVQAKNVTLSTTAPSLPRSSGRRQLFSKPHPTRMTSGSKKNLLEQLEESTSFCSYGRSLSPWYDVPVADLEGGNSPNSDPPPVPSSACEAILRNVVERDGKLWSELFQKFHFEQDDDGDDENISYQRLVAWHREVSVSKLIREGEAADIFGIGCLIAEIFLQKPLFDSTNAALWLEKKALPGTLVQLPPHVRILVESTLATDIKRRPSAQKLLESPFFPPAVRSAYTFLSSFHFLASNHDRLFYAAKMAQQSAFALMGPVASELCAPACLSVIAHPYNDLDPMAVVILLKSLLQVLMKQASRRLLLPVVQSILQENDADAQLKAGLLGSSFIRNLRQILGTHVYLQHFHSLIVLSVLRSPESQQASAASLVLVETCQELGLPVTLNQTILPLLQSLGRDITVHGIDSLVEIGERFGPQAIIKHWLPPLKYVLLLSIEPLTDKTAPTQSWRLLAAGDALTALSRLVLLLNPVCVSKELLQEPNNFLYKVFQQKNLPHHFRQAAAKTILTACKQSGPELTFLHVMPQFKELFDGLAYSNISEELELVYVLYPELASLLGIEKVRQSFPTWLLLEQSLAKKYNWKWTYTSRQFAHSTEALPVEEPSNTGSFSPANLLLNGVGWSIPQSQAAKWTSSFTSRNQDQDLVVKANEEPWFWVPTHDENGGSAESNSKSRIGVAHAGTKDEQSWKLNAIVAHSWRAHSGTVKLSRIGGDETVIFSAGGLRGRSVVRKWDLSSAECITEYSGHEEAVNDICVFQGFERVGSCDGMLHIWNSETGKRLALLDECSIAGSSRQSEVADMSLSNGTLSAGNAYTFMHFMEAETKLAIGTTSGYLRFVDPVTSRQLFSWRCETSSSETLLSLFVSSVTSSSREAPEEKSNCSSSWLAVGFNTGHCSLLDARTGSVIGSWRAHGAEITNLAPLEDHYLVSGSLDRTLSVWDLRKRLPLPLQTFQGHRDGVTSFSLWGGNILSAAGNKIGVSSFTKQGHSSQKVTPRKIYLPDRSGRNLSSINTISVLPFSRQFIIGTEDGHLKICV